MTLADFKLEFGLYKGEVVLGDEFSPDGSRLWTKKHWRKWTKTVSARARWLIEAYEAVARRWVYSWTDFSWLLVSLAGGYSG